jgi:hypothetical protein
MKPKASNSCSSRNKLTAVFKSHASCRLLSPIQNKQFPVLTVLCVQTLRPYGGLTVRRPPVITDARVRSSPVFVLLSLDQERLCQTALPVLSGFGGLVVSMLASVYPSSRVRTRPKPMDFSGEKILRSRSKTVCPMSQLRFTWKSESQAKLTCHFSPNFFLH